MKIIFMKLAVVILNIMYLVFRPFKLKDKITILSRQADTKSLDIKLLEDCLNKKNIHTVVLTKRLTKSFWGGIKYGVHMLHQMYHISTSKVVVIDGYCILISVLKKKERQEVVQIWHSLGAIKKFGYQSVGKPLGNSADVVRIMKLYRNYDYVIAPSKITANFYSEAFDIDKNKVKILGLPRIDYINSDDMSLQEKILREHPELKKKKNVLYAPTFRKDAYLNIKSFLEKFDFERYTLIIRKHWLDKTNYKCAFTFNKNIVIAQNYDVIDWIKVSDKVITDYSSVAFEAALMDKELYFYIPDVNEYEKNVGLNVNLMGEVISEYAFIKKEALFEALTEPYNSEYMRRFCNKYIDVDFVDNSYKLSEFLISLLEKYF